MKSERTSGILLHPTSLPGPYGIGEAGREAARWIDTLARMDQRLWQVLPLGPTGYGDSPYQSLSTFAGNPLLIPLDDLARLGLLDAQELKDFPSFPDDRVDFGPVIETRQALLNRAAGRFDARASSRLKAACRRFEEKQAFWLNDFALFLALKTAHGGQPWTAWEAPLRHRDPQALADADRTLAPVVASHRVQQFLFDRAWTALHARAARRGIRIVGDLPIFVAHDSADVWAHPEGFQLDGEGQPLAVAGVPPDYFSATGQRWGNPLYRWETHAAEGYAWWIARLRRTLEWVDLIRLDHFRGFAAYWSIPAHEPTAVHGAWIPGPGAAFFEAVKRTLGGLPILAEDLGVITPDVETLRDAFHLPGMRILQFTVEDMLKDPAYRPEHCPVNRAIYTGTHDNDTVVGWFSQRPGVDNTRSAEEWARLKQAVTEYAPLDAQPIQWAMIELALRSPARMAIVPLQDVLGLGSEARMNQPGHAEGNWQWRFRPEQLTPRIRKKLRQLTRQHGRH